MSTIIDGIGAHTFGYDAALNQASEEISGPLYNRTITRSRDAHARPNGLVVNDGSTNEYGTGYNYDTVGRLNSVTGPGLPSMSAYYTFRTNTDLVERTDFADVSTNRASSVRAFESHRNLPVSIENKYGTNTISKYAYRYDELGRRKDVTFTGDATAHNWYASPMTDLYAYNSRNELTQSGVHVGDDPDDPGDPAEKRYLTFAYDNIGNRTEHDYPYRQGATEYETNALNQYTNQYQTYDEDGNLTVDGNRLYSWDGENRMTGSESSLALYYDVRTEYTYDYMGRMVQRRVYLVTDNEYDVEPAVDQRYVYDGWRVIEELDGLNDNAPALQYTWGLDLAGQNGASLAVPVPGSPVGLSEAGGIGGLLAMHKAAGEVPSDLRTYYWNETPYTAAADCLYMYDANGNVGQLVFANTGEHAAAYEYYPYGGEWQSWGEFKFINPFRFSTKFWEPFSDAYYYGYRWHQPYDGRWMSWDPIEENGGYCLYGFVFNCPATIIDDLGDKPTTGHEAAAKKQSLADLPRRTRENARRSSGRENIVNTSQCNSNYCGPDVTSELANQLRAYPDNCRKGFQPVSAPVEKPVPQLLSG